MREKGNIGRMRSDQKQSHKFKEAARQLETDDDEARFGERLKKLVKQKPKDDEKEQTDNG